MVLIKKYENRRLYDTSNSRYVNLEDIAQLVKEGKEIQVVDAATGEDITRVVLTQIIAENAKGPNSAFPIDVLRQMVIATGKATQEGTLKYMQAVLDMYQNAFRAMSPAVNPFQFMRSPAAPAAEPVESPPATAASRQNTEHTSEVGDLKERVRELETLVSNLAGKKKKKGRKAGNHTRR